MIFFFAGRSPEAEKDIAKEPETQIIVTDDTSNKDVAYAEEVENKKEAPILGTKDENLSEDVRSDEIEKEKKVEVPTKVIGKMEVHFIDVGQGDAILIKQGDSSLLFDAGDNNYANTVVKYLKDNGIKKLDYILGSHPHADHIGGTDLVINTFNIGKVIMPKVTHNTKTFEDVITAIKNKSLKITTPIVGDEYALGDAKFTILAPNKSNYDNLNNHSIVIKVEYGNNSFLLTGDIEAQAESEIVNNKQNIKSDVIHIPHHGSNTSSSQSLLKAVSPSFAIISNGIENKYGHPDKSVMERLKAHNIEIYRNDLHGNIVATTDGTNISFAHSKSISPNSVAVVVPQSTTHVEAKAPEKEPVTPVVVAPFVQEPIKETPVTAVTYIGNKNSKIFHKPSCSSLPDEKNRVYFDSIDKAIGAGHRGCKRCNP